VQRGQQGTVGFVMAVRAAMPRPAGPGAALWRVGWGALVSPELLRLLSG